MKMLMITLFSLALAFTASAELEIGQPAPDFTLKDSSGKTHKLSSYKGKTVVLEWANEECPFVQRHYKDTDTMIKTAKANPDVVWLAIDSSSHRTPEMLAAWVKDESIPFPVLSDQDGTIGKLYSAKTTPHMFIIAADGKLAYQGAIDNDPRGGEDNKQNYVDKALKEIKAGKKVADAQTKPYGCSVKYK